MLKEFFRPFISYKYLLFQLTQREIKARYKQSFIGYAWVLLNPLAQLAVYSFVFSLVFRFPSDVPYPIFLFAALLPWTFFQNSITSATQSLVHNDTLLKKVAFPREIIPYSVVFSKIIDFLVSCVVFIVFLFIYQVPLAYSAWLFIPLFLVHLILTVGISLFLSAANLFYRDIQYLANLLIMLWMYMSPIVYPLSMVPTEYIWLYKLNPMVGIIEGYRSALFGYPFETKIIYWSVAFSILLFTLSFVLFKKLEKVFADIV
ncbi:MAG TPA: ABC transporter permease [Patescibacteria group bacterium]